jgi:hypothetical protein
MTTKPRRVLFIILGLLTLLRLAHAAVMELSPDEAYYFMWSERMDLAYYSKGPGVATAIWLGTHLVGANELGVRFLSPLLALGTSLLMFSFARRLYGESVAVWTVVLLNVIPIYSAGAVLMTIDPLSMFFWMAALYAFWLALERSPDFSRWWPATGALIGLGFLCKYTNALQLLSIVLLLAFAPKFRRELTRSGFWSMLGVFALFMLPPLIWNAQRDWITVSHISARGGLEKAFRISPGEFFTFLGAHFGVYSPLVFAAMLLALWWGFDRSRAHFKPRFLLLFALPILLLYFILSLREAGEANWTAPATLSLGLLTVALWHEAAQEQRGARRFCFAALVTGLLMSIITLDTDLLRRVGIPLPYSMDPSARLRGWRTAAETVESFRSDFEKQQGEPVFLIANKYQTAAILAFYMREKRPAAPGHPPVYIPESQAIENQFSFWPRYDEMVDLAQVARDYLAAAPAAGEDPRQRDEARRAVELVETLASEGGPKFAEARRGLARALRAVQSDLPIDESFVEEQGVNLFAGRTALYVTDRAEEKAPSTIKGGFERVEMIACIDFKRRGLPLRQLRIFACYNYRGMPL